MLFMLIITIVTCIITAIVSYSSWRSKCQRLMPGKRPGFFDILADVKDFLVYDAWPGSIRWQMQFFDVLRKRTEEFGKQKLFCLWLTYAPFVVFVKFEAVKEIMEKKFYDKNFPYKFMEPIFGDGLIISKTAKWKPRRKLLAPCFNSSILKGFLPVFNEHSQKLVKRLQEETEKECTDIGEFIRLLTLDIICETMFGVKIGAFENDSSAYVKSFKRMLELFMLRMCKLWNWPNWIYKLSKDGKEMMHHVQTYHEFTRNIIRERKEGYLKGQMKQEGGKHKALLDRLLEMHMERGELNEEDIREEVNTFAMAGQETVSTSIVWALFLIGLYSDVQAKIQEELDGVFGEDKRRPVTESDLGEFRYLDCVLKETMRLYPAVPWFGREIPEDTDICGHTLPKGSAIVVFSYFLHRDEAVFPDPEKFDPERFSPENISKIPEYSFIPFSAGPRNCIGKIFADMELKVIISSILRNFSVESLDARDKVLPLISITLYPSVPIRFRIRSRAIEN